MNASSPLPFTEHLEVLRRMLLRILLVVAVIAIVIFSLKDIVWQCLLAPSEHDFCTYRGIEQLLQTVMGSDFRFSEYRVDLIATELSSQFMMHITTSVYLALLLASPYVVVELFRFILPALYDNERRCAMPVAVAMYILFLLGVLMTYFVLFPVSFRFLGTYSVDGRVHSAITLDSYIDTFLSLTCLMGIVFQLPVVAFILGKMGLVTSSFLSTYRRHAFLLVLVVAAVITPPDIMTLLLVSMPLYLLFELSIRVVAAVERIK